MASNKKKSSETRASRRASRARRVRARARGTASRPRLAVFRSNRAIYVQLIDDERGVTLAAADNRALGKKAVAPADYPGRRGQAFLVGNLVAERALAKKIKAAVFDRAGYRYTGRIKALADGARAGGLQF